MSLRAALVMITVLGAAGGATAAGYTYLSGASERQRNQELANRERQIRFALSRHLEMSERPALRSVVAGRETAPGLWAFRAALAETKEKHSPAFGRALLLCEEEFDRAECWKIADLTVDGELRTKLSDRDIERALARQAEDLSLRTVDPAPETAPAASPSPQIESIVEPTTETDAPQSDAVQETENETSEQRESSMVGAALERIASAAGALRDVLIGEPDEGDKIDEVDEAAEVVDAPDPQEEQTETDVVAEDVIEDAAASKSNDNIEIEDAEAVEIANDAETGAPSVEAPESADGAAEAVESAPNDEQQIAPAEEAALEDASEGAGGEDAVAVAIVDEEPAPAREITRENLAAELQVETDAQSATAELETAPEAIADAAEAASDLQVAAAAAEVDAPTHVVRVSEVNAREAPSMQGRVLAVVTGGQNLKLIGERGSWGHYHVLGGKNDGQKVWIYGRLVAPAE